MFLLIYSLSISHRSTREHKFLCFNARTTCHAISSSQDGIAYKTENYVSIKCLVKSLEKRQGNPSFSLLLRVPISWNLEAILYFAVSVHLEF